MNKPVCKSHGMQQKTGGEQVVACLLKIVFLPEKIGKVAGCAQQVENDCNENNKFHL